MMKSRSILRKSNKNRPTSTFVQKHHTHSLENTHAHTHTPSPSLLNHIMYVLRKDLPNSSALEEIHPLSCLLSALRFVSVILNERIMQYVT